MVNMGGFELNVSRCGCIFCHFRSLLPLIVSGPVYHKEADKQHSWKYLRGILRHYICKDKPVTLLITGNNYKFICVGNRLEVSLK